MYDIINISVVDKDTFSIFKVTNEKGVGRIRMYSTL